MAKPNYMPIFYHPTNVMLLDDERKVLNNVSSVIDPIFPYILKQNPKQALEYLQTHSYDLQFLSESLSQQEYNTAEQNDLVELFTLRFSALREEMNSPEPYKKIVVAFVDHMMKGMTGLEFCKEVRELGLPVQLILLTGVAGTEDAVNAFNQGVIDAYISKNESALKKKINETLKQLARKQFQLMSQELLGAFISQSKVLRDENFKEIFEGILSKYHICEYYMIDTSCSYLLLDDEGKTKFLMVRSLSDFETIYDLARDSHAPNDVLQSIRDKQSYPFTRLDDPMPMLKGDAWEDAVVHLDKVPGRDIFYAVLEITSLETFSFKRYVNEVWPSP